MELIGGYSNIAELPKLDDLPLRNVRSTPARRRVHKAERRLRPEQINELVAKYVSGSPTSELVVAYGIGNTTARRILHDHGVELRNQGAKNIDLQEATTLYVDGWSLKTLGERYGCDPETVRKALQDTGVSIRRRRGWKY